MTSEIADEAICRDTWSTLPRTIVAAREQSSTPDRTLEASLRSIYTADGHLFPNSTLSKSQTLPHQPNQTATISTKRRFDLNLPQFHELIRSPYVPSHDSKESSDGLGHPAPSQTSMDIFMKAAPRHQLIRSSSLGPPTPPLESESVHWLSQTPSGEVQRSNARQEGTFKASASASQSTSNLHSSGQGNISRANVADTFSSPNASVAPWLERALTVAGKQRLTQNFSSPG